MIGESPVIGILIIIIDIIPEEAETKKRKKIKIEIRKKIKIMKKIEI